ncbi:MAG: TIGR00341 family protein [Peptococcaceae bacterium]|nr:TIGR00341 family protein [Peptococcaceae bacterium]
MKISDILKDAFSLKNDTAEQEEIRTRLIEGGQVSGSNLGILMLAILIASIGLNMNSTAVIIGAMLISPLMGSIQAAAYGIASADLKLFRKSSIGLFFQIFLSLLTSTLYFKISPISTATSELLARTQPTIWDVLIALCGGLAGIIGMTRTEKTNVLPGVAIATALMPPLCTCGYGIATGQWEFLWGAGYLFCVNAYFILFASTLILEILNVPKKHVMLSNKQRQAIKRKIIINTIIVILPSIFVAYNMVQTANNDRNSITGFSDSQTTVSVETLSEEASILFPDISALSVKQVENVNMNNGSMSQALELDVKLSEAFSDIEKQQFKEWIEYIYQENIAINYIIQ